MRPCQLEFEICSPHALTPVNQSHNNFLLGRKGRRGGGGRRHTDEAPRTVKLHVNHDGEFKSAECVTAAHTIRLPSNTSDEAEFLLDVKFNNVGTL